jgi:hypothetical protein
MGMDFRAGRDVFAADRDDDVNVRSASALAAAQHALDVKRTRHAHSGRPIIGASLDVRIGSGINL